MTAVMPKGVEHMMAWVAGLGLKHGSSFDLDFHTIPFHGDDDLVEKHYVSKRSRRQKGILAFLAQDGDKRFFCYSNCDLRKETQNDEILAFVRFWKERTGQPTIKPLPSGGVISLGTWWKVEENTDQPYFLWQSAEDILGALISPFASFSPSGSR
jgi:hypothetical protein